MNASINKVSRQRLILLGLSYQCSLPPTGALSLAKDLVAGVILPKSFITFMYILQLHAFLDIILQS